MGEVVAVVAVVVIGGVAVRILQRRTDRGGPYEDYGFDVPELDGVTAFGGLTRGDAEASAEALIESATDV